MTPEPIETTAVRELPDHHVLAVLVENKAGVLSRVAGLFSRRGFNIYSLAVAPTDRSHRFSRITIVVDAASAPLHQVVNQLGKLVNVISISHVNEASVIERELLLATVTVDEERQTEVVRLCSVFSAEVVDVGGTEMTVVLAGTPDKVDGFESLLGSFEVTALHRTGMVALPKLRRSLRALDEPTGTAG
jgi:acetolactate synthase I/III small subunit